MTGGTLGIDYVFDAADRVLTIKTNTAITISGTTKTDHIEVADGVSADITLKDVNIDVSDTGTFLFTAGVAAFKIADNSTGNVNITLEGANTLKSGFYCAGLQKNDDGTGIGKLTLSGSGSLESTGGLDGAGISGCSCGLLSSVGFVLVDGLVGRCDGL